MSDIQFTPEFIQYQRDMLQEEFGDPVFPLPDVPVFQIATKLYPAALDTIDALRAEIVRSRAVVEAAKALSDAFAHPEAPYSIYAGGLANLLSNLRTALEKQS